jgi:transcriptional regulator with XRE-family HTH domain
MNLQQLRESAKLSHGAVLKKLHEVAPDAAPASRNAVFQWERRGIRDVEIIEALALVYGVPFETVRAAAQATRHEARSSGILAAA